MFRFNPALKAEGKAAFSIDSKEPSADYVEFLKGETRYARLAQQFPERAEELFKEAEKLAKEKFEHIKKLGIMYSGE